MFGNAESYERFMGRWSRIAAPLLVEFAEVPDIGHVLDIGCGTGILATTIAAATPAVQVTGIDPSEEYIDYANERSSLSGRTTFELGDASALRFPDRHFVAALSLLAFNFFLTP